MLARKLGGGRHQHHSERVAPVAIPRPQQQRIGGRTPRIEVDDLDLAAAGDVDVHDEFRQRQHPADLPDQLVGDRPVLVADALQPPEVADQMVLAHRGQRPVADEEPEFAGDVHAVERAQADAADLTGGGAPADLLAGAEDVPDLLRAVHRAVTLAEADGVGRRAVVDRSEDISGKRLQRTPQKIAHPLIQRRAVLDAAAVDAAEILHRLFRQSDEGGECRVCAQSGIPAGDGEKIIGFRHNIISLK